MFKIGIIQDGGSVAVGALGRITLTSDMLVNVKLMGQEEQLVNEGASLILDGSLNPDQLSKPTPCGDWTLQNIGQRICFNPWDAVRTPTDQNDKPWEAEVIIDLGRVYRITNVYLYIEPDLPTAPTETTFKIDAGDAFDYTTNVVTLDNNGVLVFDEWKRVTVDITTRYLRLTQGRNFGIVAELGLYGQTVGAAPVVPAVTPISSTVTFDKMVGANVRSGMGIDQGAGRNYDENFGSIRWFSNGIYMFDNADNVINWVQDNATISRLVSKGVDVWYTTSGAAPTMVDPLANSGGNYTGEKSIDYLDRLGTKVIAGVTSGYPNADIPAKYAHKAWLTKKAAIALAPKGMTKYETENETDIYLRGAGWMLPFELAAMMSADYDGHENTLTYNGESVGIKNSGTSVEMVMPGLAYPSKKTLRAMAFWVEHHRSDKKFPCDIVNVHVYPNQIELPAGSFAGGVSPEDLSYNSAQMLQDVKDFRDKYAPHALVYDTEVGWDTYYPVHPSFGTGHFCAPSTYGGIFPGFQSFQYAQTIGANDPWEVQGQWVARAALQHAAEQFDRVNFFWLGDVGAEEEVCGSFNASGLLSLPSPGTAYVPKRSWYYLQTLRFRLKDMLFTSATVQNVAGTDAYVYKFTHVSDVTNLAYIAWFPTSTAHTAAGVSIPVTLGNYETIQLTPGNEMGVVSATNTAVTGVTVNLSERPVMICTKLPAFNKFQNAEAALGRTLTGTEITQFTAFFAGLVTDGLDTIIKAAWIPMGTQATTAVNIVNPGTFDLAFSGGACTFTANEVQWGVNSYADSGFNPAVHAAVANEVSIGYMSNGATSNGSISIGCFDWTNFLWLRYCYYVTGPGSCSATLFGATEVTGTFTTDKLALVTTNGANSKVIYDGTVAATQATTGVAPNYSIWVGAANAAGSGNSFETNPMRFAFIAGEMSDGQAANWNTRVNNLITGLGH